MAGETRRLVEYAHALRYENLPAAVVHQAKRLILDTLTCTVSGVLVDGGKIFQATVKAMGGVPEATLIPEGTKTSAANAAFVNCALANMLDLDDNLLYFSHFANSCVPPPLAAAEAAQASGKDLITAVVAAYEVASRLSLSMPGVGKVYRPPPDLRLDWPNPFGYSYNALGAVIGASKIYRLSLEQTAHALGIAGYAAPLPSVNKWSTLNKRPMIGRQPCTFKYSAFGWMGWTGIVAARLAQEGMTGDPEVLDGDFGFWKMMGAESCDWELLTDRLNEHWWILETSFKVYTAGTWSRPAITAIEHIVRSERLLPHEIESIEVANFMSRGNENTNFGMKSSTQAAAEPWLDDAYPLAMAALQVPRNRWHAAETSNHPDTIAMLARISTTKWDEAARDFFDQVKEGNRIRRARGAPSRVRIRARGNTFERIERYGLGDPYTRESTLSDEGLIEKFRSFTADILRSSHQDEAIGLVFELDKLSDVSRFARCFTA